MERDSRRQSGVTFAVSAFGTTQAIGGNPQLYSEGYARAELIPLKVADKQPWGLGQHDIRI